MKIHDVVDRRLRTIKQQVLNVFNFILWTITHVKAREKTSTFT